MDFNSEHTSIILGRIIARSISGTITPEERAMLDDWLKDEKNQQIYADIRNGASIRETLSMFDGFDVSDGYRRFETSVVPQKKSFWLRPWMAAAAAVALVLTVSVIVYRSTQMENLPIAAVTENNHDIPPGGNRATLTLADGRTITLDEAREGIVIGGDEITYNDGNPLAEVEENDEVTLLELRTPKGGTYKITLSDGTQVWLNAASTMKYPPHFTGKERVVELMGEAYFSVAKDASRPFKVVSAGQEVEVLGTEFNISAYSDDAETKTTLVGGSVQVENSRSNVKRRLSPGEQSTTHGTSTGISSVSVAQYIAWKAGMFHFKHTPFEEMMGQIERWYDVEIVYKKGVPKDTFSGRMRRDVSLLTVLDLLNVSEIAFRLEGNKLIIE